MGKDTRDPSSSPTGLAADEQLDRVRRRLLKIGVYATPLLLGTLSLQQARAEIKSCSPENCRPFKRRHRCEPAECRPINF
jgi:hypothetical protein